MPVVLQDSIPAGTSYVGGSAAASNSYSFTANPTILYSTDNGSNWTTTEPSPASNTPDIQWWLDVAMPVDGEATVTFQVDVDNPYTEPSPFINNTAGLSFGAATPFVEDSAITMIQGSNSIGDLVWHIPYFRAVAATSLDGRVALRVGGGVLRLERGEARVALL